MSLLLRPYRDADATSVVSVYRASHEDRPSFPPTTEAAWRQFTNASFNRGARDFMVGELDGELVAVLTSTLLSESGLPVQHFRIVVSPRYRRRGIGRSLLAVVEERARGAAAALQSNCNGSWNPGVAFLEDMGFGVHAGSLVMRCDELVLPPADLPRGACIRPYLPDSDDASWVEIGNAAYAEQPEVVPLSPSDLPRLRAAAGFGLVFAEVDGRAVAFAHVCSLQGTGLGLVESVAVHPSVQRSGLGSAVLSGGMRLLSRRGLMPAELTVDRINTRAQKLYRRFGFRQIDEIRTYRRRAA